MYHFIKNPETNRNVSIFTKKGEKILEKYVTLMNMSGGSGPPDATVEKEKKDNVEEEARLKAEADAATAKKVYKEKKKSGTLTAEDKKLHKKNKKEAKRLLRSFLDEFIEAVGPDAEEPTEEEFAKLEVRYYTSGLVKDHLDQTPKTSLEDFKAIVQKEGLEKVMTATFVNDFDRDETPNMISYIDKYNGVYETFMNAPVPSNDIDDNEENIIYVAFPDPIKTYEFLLMKLMSEHETEEVEKKAAQEAKERSRAKVEEMVKVARDASDRLHAEHAKRQQAIDERRRLREVRQQQRMLARQQRAVLAAEQAAAAQNDE